MATNTGPEHVDERQPLLSQPDSNLERNQQQKHENASSTFYLSLTVLAIGTLFQCSFLWKPALDADYAVRCCPRQRRYLLCHCNVQQHFFPIQPGFCRSLDLDSLQPWLQCCTTHGMLSLRSVPALKQIQRYQVYLMY